MNEFKNRKNSNNKSSCEMIFTISLESCHIVKKHTEHVCIIECYYLIIFFITYMTHAFFSTTIKDFGKISNLIFIIII